MPSKRRFACGSCWWLLPHSTAGGRGSGVSATPPGRACEVRYGFAPMPPCSAHTKVPKPASAVRTPPAPIWRYRLASSTAT